MDIYTVFIGNQSFKTEYGESYYTVCQLLDSYKNLADAVQKVLKDITLTPYNPPGWALNVIGPSNDVYQHGLDFTNSSCWIIKGKCNETYYIVKKVLH